MAKQQLYMYHDQYFFQEDHRRSFFPRLEIVTSKLMETDAENCIEAHRKLLTKRQHQ